MSMSFSADPSGTFGTIKINGVGMLQVNDDGTLTNPTTGKVIGTSQGIVGTVSQLAGVPTGAIMERGSNANGEYIKFADGTLICTKIGHSMSSETTGVFRGDWTFPAVFASNEMSCHASIPIGGNADQALFRRACVRVTAYTAGTSSAVVRGTTFSTGTAVAFPNTAYVEDSVALLAIGRWF